MAIIRTGGKAYDSGDVQIVIDGEQFFEVTEITYGNTQEHQMNFSLQNNGTSYSMGKITPEASMTCYMKDQVRLEKKGNGSLLGIKPFDIQITYVNADNEIINDTILCKFTNEGREVTGEMGLKKQFPLFALGVYLNS